MPVSLRRPSSSLLMNAESVRLSWVIFDETQVKEILSLDDSLNVSALIAIGHPAVSPTVPARKSVQELLQYR